jgi:hypothetical protein
VIVVAVPKRINTNAHVHHFDFTGLGLPLKPSGASAQCSDSKAWSGTIDVINKFNSTDVEAVETTAYIYLRQADGKNGNLKTTATDTTAGSLSLTCGETYNVEILSTDGVSGDSAGILSGSGYSVDANGVLTYSAQGTGERISVNSYRGWRISVDFIAFQVPEAFHASSEKTFHSRFL